MPFSIRLSYSPVLPMLSKSLNCAVERSVFWKGCVAPTFVTATVTPVCDGVNSVLVPSSMCGNACVAAFAAAVTSAGLPSVPLSAARANAETSRIRVKTLRSLEAVVKEQYPDRAAHDSLTVPASFNDHPDTTWEQVQMVFGVAIMHAERLAKGETA